MNEMKNSFTNDDTSFAPASTRHDDDDENRKM